MSTAAPSLIEGKAKTLEAKEKGLFSVCFKDSATAFNGQKKETIPGKGALNRNISALLFELLTQFDLPTCFVERGVKDNELIYQALTMIPLEVVVRNQALGSVCKRYQLQEYSTFKHPMVEFFLKADAANDPLISENTISALGILPDSVELERLTQLALAANTIFIPFFKAAGIDCADFKLEFGVDADGNVVIGDELSPDNFRLRDSQTKQILDKDVFRLNQGDMIETYTTLYQRIQSVDSHSILVQNSLYPVKVTVGSRKGILNPESKTILNGLHALGYNQVSTLNAGKSFSMMLEAPHFMAAEQLAHSIAHQVLSNEVIEDTSVGVCPYSRPLT